MRFSPRLARAATAVALTVLASTGVSACSSSSTTADSTASSAAQAPVNGARLSPQDFQKAAAAPGTTLIDVRTPEEFAGGHLSGARNIDIEGPNFASEIDSLDQDATYALYCRSDNRSGAALQQMTGAGFGHVYDLRGGIVAWQDAGGKVVTGG